MKYDEKIEALKEAAQRILNYGDAFTLQKNYEKVIVRTYDENRDKKAYNSLAIIKRYNNKTDRFVNFLFLFIFFITTVRFNLT